MVNDVVSTYLIFEESNPPDIYPIVKRLISNGWGINEHLGEYMYDVDGERKWSSSEAELLEDLKHTSSASVDIQQDGFQVYIVKNSSDLWVESQVHIELWTQAINFQYYQRSKSKNDALRNVDRYLTAIKSAANILPPTYGFGTWPDETDPYDVPGPNELGEGQISNIFWLNIFPRHLIDSLGVKSVEDIPAYTVEELSSGLILVLTADNPVEPSSEWKDGRTRVAQYLGIE